MFDTRLRLTAEALLRLAPTHLHSGIDSAEDASAASGFTEWIVEAQRALSMGWDWSFNARNGTLTAHWETLRTNVLVVNASGQDLGWTATRECIAALMDRVGWTAVTARAVGLPPPPVH